MNTKTQLANEKLLAPYIAYYTLWVVKLYYAHIGIIDALDSARSARLHIRPHSLWDTTDVIVGHLCIHTAITEEIIYSVYFEVLLCHSWFLVRIWLHTTVGSISNFFRLMVTCKQSHRGTRTKAKFDKPTRVCQTLAHSHRNVICAERSIFYAPVCDEFALQ